MPEPAGIPLPPRIRVGPLGVALGAGLLALGLWSLQRGLEAGGTLVEGLPHMRRIFDEMVPPRFERMESVGRLLVETAVMAFAGAAAGCGVALLVAPLGARNLSPHPLVYQATRGMVALFRTVPDLVWAIFFVASVGLGPVAGTLTILVDTVGFCGRFYADAMEDAPRGPQEALAAVGAGRLGVVLASVVPAAGPSVVGTSMFALEKAVRASVVLGLVGAGGIGIELKAAMDMFEYAHATTIILAIFVLVLVVERLGSWVRRAVQ